MYGGLNLEVITSSYKNWPCGSEVNIAIIADVGGIGAIFNKIHTPKRITLENRMNFYLIILICSSTKGML